MDNYSNNTQLVALQAKGGVMYFTVERLDKLYRGMVLLSSVNNNHRTRIVCMKVYRYKEG